jgi:hypothetical protein
MRLRWDTVGSGFHGAGGACLRRQRCGAWVEAVWLSSRRRSQGSPVRRSIAVRRISTDARCRRGEFVVPVAGVVRFARTTRGSSPRSTDGGKTGFGMEYMPCGSFQANAVSFAIGALTYNLYLGFRSDALGSEHSQVQTVCWRLFHGVSVSETPEIPAHGQKIAGGAG